MADPRLKKLGLRGFNKPKRTPKHPTKSHVVLAKQGNKIKTVRFGQQGVRGAGNPKKGESATQKARRKSFRNRHNCATATNKLTARYWSCKVKW
tara:strand:+ start:159 stop:440 length:282 start_codon:yes stop_codon:yes gene_type:complete